MKERAPNPRILSLEVSPCGLCHTGMCYAAEQNWALTTQKTRLAAYSHELVDYGCAGMHDSALFMLSTSDACTCCMCRAVYSTEACHMLMHRWKHQTRSTYCISILRSWCAIMSMCTKQRGCLQHVRCKEAVALVVKSSERTCHVLQYSSPESSCLDDWLRQPSSLEWPLD